MSEKRTSLRTEEAVIKSISNPSKVKSEAQSFIVHVFKIVYLAFYV